MKAIRLLRRHLVPGLTATLIAFAAPLTSAAERGEILKGGQLLLRMQEIKTPKDLNALKTDDQIAMVCAKCKTVWVTRVKEGVKGAQILMEGGKPTEIIGTHACAGCNSTIEIAGHGKGKEAVLKHSCKACGDNSAFCCATKPGSGPTKGMEKK
jgi:hypothetical protein